MEANHIAPSSSAEPQPSAAPKKGRFLGIRTRLLLRFTLVFTLAWAGATYWFHQFAANAATRRIERDMVDTLNATVGHIDGDVVQALVAEVPPGETDDPRYLALEEWLHTVIDVKPYATVYVYVPGQEPNEVLFVADASHLEGVETSYLSDPGYELEPETYLEDADLLAGLSETIVRPNYRIEDEFGSFVAAYTPLYNSAGEPVGAVGVDYDAEFVSTLQQEATRSLLTLLAIGYVVGFALVFATATLWTRPFAELTRAARAISRGEYKQDLSPLYNVRLRSEISELAEAIEESGRVHIRELVLIERVHKLEIEIDEAKAARQVSEIVDSEFFQDLKAKAKALRQEHSGEDPAAHNLTPPPQD